MWTQKDTVKESYAKTTFYPRVIVGIFKTALEAILESSHYVCGAFFWGEGGVNISKISQPGSKKLNKQTTLKIMWEMRPEFNVFSKMSTFQHNNYETSKETIKEVWKKSCLIEWSAIIFNRKLTQNTHCKCLKKLRKLWLKK